MTTALPRTPYDEDGYAETYEATFNTSPDTLPNFDFEIAHVQHALTSARSWCDVACGTGLHLRTATSPHSVRRVGIDRSARMLAQAARTSPDWPIAWVEADVCAHPVTDRFDLVTHFWWGHVHQPTLDAVERFFSTCVALVAPGGTFLFDLDDMPLDHEVSVAGSAAPVTFDAVIWSWRQIERAPEAGFEFRHCIAPHPDLVHAWLEPHFAAIEKVDYPHHLPPESQKTDASLWLCTGRQDRP